MSTKRNWRYGQPAPSTREALATVFDMAREMIGSLPTVQEQDEVTEWLDAVEKRHFRNLPAKEVDKKCE